MTTGRARTTFSLGVVVALIALLLSLPTVAATQENPALQQRGRELYVSNCSSCHGANGAGSEFGPSLRGVGAASADFQLRTGRMPLADPTAPSLRKPPALSDEEIDAVVAYVASLGEGPRIPEVNIAGANVAPGETLFVANCAPCHGASANGGPVGEDAFAPSLHASQPVVIAEAMIVGPGQMPVFAFSEQERNDIVVYVRFLQEQNAPGGLDIGGIGPVPEGFVAWVVAMVALVIVVVLIGRRSAREKGA
jgi:ubiquinol-cytochrome c reductase cytochrome c subunit